MSEEQYHSVSHCKYLIQYHIIWCLKFRFSVLQGNAARKGNIYSLRLHRWRKKSIKT